MNKIVTLSALLVALVAGCASNQDENSAAAREGVLPAGLPEGHGDEVAKTAGGPEQGEQAPDGASGAAGPTGPSGARAKGRTPAQAAGYDPARYSLARVDDGDDSIWNDPDFRRRFIESYVAETDIEPTTVLEDRLELQKIYTLLNDEKREQALGAIETILAGERVNAVFYFTAGNVLLELGRFDEAAERYRQAIDKHPKYRRAWVGLGETAVRKEDYAGALPALVKVIELGGGDGLTYGMLGNAHSAAGNHLSAESAYRMATLLDPNRILWHQQLARTLFLQERYSDAAALFAGLIEGDPTNVSYWLGQAEAYVKMDQPMRAAENLEFVDGLGKSNASMLNTLGDIYTNEGLLDVAAQSYLRAYEQDPVAGAKRAIRAAKDVWTRGGGRHTLSLVERIDELSAGQLVPEDEKDFLALRARIALQRGADEEAAEVLRRVVDLDPLDGDALLRLGDHHRARKELDQAIFYYERAQGVEAFRQRALMAQIRVLLGQDKDAEALPMLQEVARSDGSEAVQKLLEEVQRRIRTSSATDG